MKMMVTLKGTKGKESKSSGTDLERVRQQSKSSGKEDNDPRLPPDYELIYHKNRIVDMKLKFGNWTGFRITEMLDDNEGRRYITSFLLDSSNTFPSKMVAAIEEIMDDHRE